MLKELQLINYRGFEEHIIPFSNLNIIVGSNNAGKSTVVEALRILSLFTNRYKGLNYHKPPNWTNLSGRYFGASPSIKNMEIKFETICHQYHDDKPAIIKAIFDEGSCIEVYLNRDGEIHGILYSAGEKIINSKSMALHTIFPTLNILPQVAPLAKEEFVLDEEYVNHSKNTSISFLHFRNQLKIYEEYFQSFQNNVSNSWPGILVNNLDYGNGLPGSNLSLEIRNDGFVAEVSAMGHGLQMWLQVIWFLTLNKKSSTIILDEPDVYMHADLQKRLIRMIRNAFPQIILTTHSVEIISEVQPENILIIDKNVHSSKFANSLPAVQKIVERTGSIHNIQITRLWHTKKVIFVEGKDLKYLKIFQDLLYPDSKVPIDTIPNLSIGGWGGWSYVIGSDLFLKNNIGQNIKVYCILDSDYHSTKEILNRYNEAKSKKICLHIWRKKEIENYLIIPSVIQRVIKKQSPKKYPSVENILNTITCLCNKYEDELFDLISEEIVKGEKIPFCKANKQARSKIKEYKGNNNLQSKISGKKLISELSIWSQTNFNSSLGTNSLLREIKKEEIDNEVFELLTEIVIS